jgi:hypothetical protein
MLVVVHIVVQARWLNTIWFAGVLFHNLPGVVECMHGLATQLHA